LKTKGKKQTPLKFHAVFVCSLMILVLLWNNSHILHMSIAKLCKNIHLSWVFWNLDYPSKLTRKRFPFQSIMLLINLIMLIVWKQIPLSHKSSKRKPRNWNFFG
jgi:hypothetical protein